MKENEKNEEEKMHEYEKWEADFMEMKADWYIENIGEL